MLKAILKKILAPWFTDDEALDARIRRIAEDVRVRAERQGAGAQRQHIA